MYAVVRTYSGKGAKELFDMLDSRKSPAGRPSAFGAVSVSAG
jgi:hypothetical protein